MIFGKTFINFSLLKGLVLSVRVYAIMYSKRKAEKIPGDYSFERIGAIFSLQTAKVRIFFEYNELK